MAEAIIKNLFYYCRVVQDVMGAVDELGMELHDPFRNIVDPYTESGANLKVWKVLWEQAAAEVVGVLLSNN